jgi:acyl phosphate:glycerol-3-phosphate acyltransferase
MSDVGLSDAAARALVVTLVAIALGIFLVGYAIGSIPFGYVIGRLFFRTDIRTRGSGNIGAMNALRTLGAKGAAAVLLLDALKGFVPTFLTIHLFGRDLDPDFRDLFAALVAGGTVLGHCFSPWLRFRGGKGVATSFGATFALCWPAGLVAAAGWCAGAAITRYSSVGSMLGSVLSPLAIFFFTRSVPATLYGVFAACLVLFKHRDNIARLRAGAESRILLSKPSAVPKDTNA